MVSRKINLAAGTGSSGLCLHSHLRTWGGLWSLISFQPWQFSGEGGAARSEELWSLSFPSSNA